MNSWQPTAAVVVPVYNAERTIDECVRSLLELRYPADRLTLLLVDNGSTDGTEEALRGYREPVVLLREHRRGAAAARNTGLRHAAAEVVAFTDADCVVEPDWLLHLVAPLENPEVGIAGGTIRARQPANEAERFGETIHDHQRAMEVFKPPYAITMNWASRLELIRRIGGFDERFPRGQDVELSFRVTQAGYALAFVREAVVYHRNERDLTGLFREGFQHGLYSVKVLKRHEDFVRQFGHPRVNLRSYAKVGAAMLHWALHRHDPRARYDATFDAGKKLGKLLGSARFGHLDL